MSREDFDGGYHLWAKEKHKERVLKTPSRIEYAISRFEENEIKYELKNKETGHFHCWRKSNNKLYEFYAGTGKIKGIDNKRGVNSMIKILTR